MALIDKASLLMVPSTYEDGTLYNVLPSGNKAPDETGNNNAYDQTRADFTFSRGSNLAATRVNAAGLIEKGRENLFTNSNTLSGVTLDNLTRTTGHADPLGGNNAALLTENTSTGTHRFYIFSIPASDAVHTYSIYAKPNGRNRFQIVADGGGINAQWNISTGTLIGDSNEIKSNIEDVGDGWYRLSLTYYGAGWIGGYFFNDSGSNSYTGDGTSGVYVFGAQVEKGLVATDYIETTTTTAKAGVLESMPRIDYSSGAGALLLEPLRTNVITQSEYFGAWNGFRTDLSANSATSPEGISNAYSMVPNTDNNTHFIYFNTSESAVDYSFSLFAKSNGQQWIQLAKGGGGYANFDLTNGVKGNYGTDGSSAFTDSKIEDYGNGWYRITAYYTSVGGASNIGIAAISSDVTARYQSFAGDGTSGYYIYGAQLESSASYESSYIPTMGTAASRAADSCSVTGVSDVIGQSEGTMFVEFEYSNNSVGVVSIHSGNIGNRVYIGTDSNGLITQVRVGYVQQAFFSTPLTIGTTYKCAIAYKANDFVLYVNGSQIGTDTSGSVPSLMIKLGFESGAGGDVLNQPTKQTMLFKERLSNTELAALTA